MAGLGRGAGPVDALGGARRDDARLALKTQALQDKVAGLQQKLELTRRDLARALAEDSKHLKRQLSGAREETAGLEQRLATMTALLGDAVQRLDAVAAHADTEAAELDAATLLQLAEAFRSGGDLGMAAARLHACGPSLAEQLRRDVSPDGHIVGPDFLIIGSPRAASSWLRRLLALHPDLFLLAHEQHYFEDPRAPLADYVGRFASAEHMLMGRDPRAAAPDRRLFGEKSPRYAAMPEANIAFLAALYPKLRLICTVREPVARAWSEIRMSGLQAQACDPAVLSGTRRCEPLETVIRHGRYLEHLTRWARRFPLEQILLLDFDQIRDAPASAVAQAFAHLGVAAHPIAPEHLWLPPGAPAPTEPPASLARHLQDAYRGQPCDAAALRAALAQAAWRNGAARVSRLAEGAPAPAAPQARARSA